MKYDLSLNKLNELKFEYNKIIKQFQIDEKMINDKQNKIVELNDSIKNKKSKLNQLNVNKNDLLKQEKKYKSKIYLLKIEIEKNQKEENEIILNYENNTKGLNEVNKLIIKKLEFSLAFFYPIEESIINYYGEIIK